MRTWKQGAVGRIRFEDGRVFYFRCLKYPLARFYRGFDAEARVLEGLLCDALLDLSVLRYMERREILPVSKADLDKESSSDGEGLLDMEKLNDKLNRSSSS